ncbi:hypothetical protein ACQZM9_21685 [Streptomyces sp. P11-1]|uniref:hypothetical protein n=1 Tax=Streptomyces sp. P11-1 TaxID=3423221 RepID=UPI003D2F1FB0
MTDDMVMQRALIDHTARCEVCDALAATCPYKQRLSELAAVTREIARQLREEQREERIRVGADTGLPTGPHCRAACLSGSAGLHLDCCRPVGRCVCFCHQDDQLPT